MTDESQQDLDAAGPASVPFVVLAGGMGTRFGGDRPKQIAEVAGRSVLAHTLARLDEHPEVEEIVIPAHEQWRTEIESIARDAVGSKPATVVAAGSHRNLSVLNGVRAIHSSTQHVAVHDGVRPLVSPELISRTLAAARAGDAAIPVVPLVDPIVELADDRVVRVVDRSALFRGQSPQVFRRQLLLDALEDDRFDPTSVATLYEVVLRHRPDAVIVTVPGEDQNLKITSPIDHLVAEQILSRARGEGADE
jgi:2-C-methyl-D-erythritol 4-phosphate cytidylyltransferase